MDALPADLAVIADRGQCDTIASKCLQKIFTDLARLDAQCGVAENRRHFSELPVTKRFLSDRFGDFPNGHANEFEFFVDVGVVVWKGTGPQDTAWV